MSILRTLFGGGKREPLGYAARKHGPDSMHLQAFPVSSNGRVEVHGEAQYQDTLKHASRGGDSYDTPDGFVVAVRLVPEPTNPYDSNAVRVDIESAEQNWPVGYLTREDAPAYHQVLTQKIPAGYVATCPGRIWGGGERRYGIWLDLASADLLVCEGSYPPGSRLLLAHKTVTVTGEEQHQEFLSLALAGRPRVRVYATLAPMVIDKGTHAGKAGLQVLIGGQVVGMLTKAMSDRYGVLVDGMLARGEVPVCESVIRLGERGAQVELALPTGSELPGGL